MIDDDELTTRLARDLAEHQAAWDAPPGLMAAARTRARRRRARTSALAAAAAVLVVGGVTVAALDGPDEDATVTAGPGDVTGPTWRGPVPPPHTVPSVSVTPSVSIPLPDGPPSQSPEDGARDGVHPEVAALPVAARVEQRALAEDGLEMWMLSRVPEIGIAAAGADLAYGDVDGTYGEDFINPVEYGEVLLLGSGIPILKAYPLPGHVPSWIHLTADAVYAGRVGDGGLPHSSLVRIDRTTLEAEVVVFPVRDEQPRFPARPGWRAATAAEVARYPALVTVGPDATGTPVTSAIGPVGVDIAGVEALFAAG